MKSKVAERFKKQIDNDWEGTNTLPVVSCIYEHLVVNFDDYDETHLNIQMFCDMLNECPCNGIPDIEDEILKSINYLSDMHINFLRICYEYHDSFGIHEISYDEIIDAEREGSLVHPTRGELIYEYKNNIAISFMINSNFSCEVY